MLTAHLADEFGCFGDFYARRRDEQRTRRPAAEHRHRMGGRPEECLRRTDDGDVELLVHMRPQPRPV